MQAFKASYQVVLPAPPGAGCVFKYRKPEQQGLVVAEAPALISAVISRSLKLADGEVVEVVQWTTVGDSKTKVFV
jgi:hypothetical protein